MLSVEEIAFLVKITFLTRDTYVTFDPKLVRSQVHVHTFIIVTKFDTILDGLRVIPENIG